MDDAIAQSCNVYFAHAGLALGGDALRQSARQFGFSHLPSPLAFGANLPDIAYGQGPMLVSPTEMASVVQTVGNNGVRFQPTYRRDAIEAHGAAAIAPADAARLQAALLRVTQSGTAAGRFGGLPFAVAGKTGTAQNTSGDKVAHSWFVGYAPADHPRIAFAVMVENGGYGAQVAVPITNALLHTLPNDLTQTVAAK
jgi:cell division protein FtsI/penicillin-binding protein 2